MKDPANDEKEGRNNKTKSTYSSGKGFWFNNWKKTSEENMIGFLVVVKPRRGIWRTRPKVRPTALIPPTWSGRVSGFIMIFESIDYCTTTSFPLYVIGVRAVGPALSCCLQNFLKLLKDQPVLASRPTDLASQEMHQQQIFEQQSGCCLSLKTM